ncbi:Uncharacterized protein APZ42_031844 [Daphnia magna]|uniref:Uncharacterized protein n=1 Tax=Daphnia magna TaxID=35525 RepID=A0A164MHJ4_9CRUS|nr:Uncharacterized protein APZ42_031844 [Daphnia magna]
MIEGLKLIDIWKKLRKTEPGHTFHHHVGSSRLDRIHANKAFADNFRIICLQPLSISDHQSIQSSFTCNLNIPHLAKSTVGLWKMNVLIFLEEGFQTNIVEFIKQCSNHPLRLSNVANWWESVLKPGIRRIAIAYCKQRARRIRETKMFYQSCMQDIAQADTFDWVAFQELRNFSKSWEESTLKGFGVRSRCFEGEENEDATILHVSRARENFHRCCIEKIIASNGECLTTKEDVSKEIVSNFTSIFKSQSFPDMLAGTGFLEGIRDCCKVSPNPTVPISSFEIKSALIQTKKNKSPVFTGPVSPENSLLRFWLSFPLRNMLQLYNRNKPAAVIERPSYLLEPLRQIKDLLSAGILAQGKPMIHKKTYRHWIQEVSGPGKIEILRPDLDWPNIWREIAALPANVKETMFLFNQRLLPTRTRCHRFDSLADENYQLFHQFPETDEHLVIYCPLRNKVWSWLEGTVRRHGCKTFQKTSSVATSCQQDIA